MPRWIRAEMTHKIIQKAAQKAGLRCSRTAALVEVVKGPAIEQGLHHAMLCADPGSPTGTTAVINYHGRVVFLPFGKRRDWRAWVVPRFGKHPVRVSVPK